MSLAIVVSDESTSAVSVSFAADTNDIVMNITDINTNKYFFLMLTTPVLH